MSRTDLRAPAHRPRLAQINVSTRQGRRYAAQSRFLGRTLAKVLAKVWLDSLPSSEL